MSTAPVIVIGAGIGGLACASQLAAHGVDVLVVEKQPYVGGKLRTVAVGEHRFDAGPTVLTMRWVFDELFADAGDDFGRRLTLKKAGTLARHAWDDGRHFDLFADLERSADAIGDFAGAAEARGYRAFCARAASIYRTLEGPFLREAQPNPVSLARRVGWRGLGDLARISPFATMWSTLAEYFRDPRLLQLFGRYATYCGSSPFAAPATLMLVAHVERDGVWQVGGGMHRIAEAFAALVEARGGRLRVGEAVADIVVEHGRATGVRLASGEHLDASAVVFNGDTAALAGGLLGRAAAAATSAIRREQRSLSAFTWHLATRTRGRPLLHHNVFFGGDSRHEFADLFERRVAPGDPTVYLCAQDRSMDDDAEGQDDERLMCLVNAPADADQDPTTAVATERIAEAMFARLTKCGVALEAPGDAALVTTPADFGRLFPATGGALYGRATHGWAASFERAASRSRFPGLYLAGGSVHPGPGLPMAALSGRLAAASVIADRGAGARRANR